MKRSRLIALSAIGLAVVLATVATLALLYLPMFQVSKVTVAGNSHVTSEEIEDAAAITPSTPLVRVNTHAAAERVAALPWVSKVKVDRSFPDSVSVTVEERTAMMFARRDDGQHLFDATGRPFVIETPPPGSVEVVGTKSDDPAVFGDIATAVAALDPLDRDGLERVEAPSRFELRLFFRGGKEVYWGSVEQAHDKARATSTVLKREGKRWNVSAPGMVTLIP